MKPKLKYLAKMKTTTNSKKTNVNFSVNTYNTELMNEINEIAQKHNAQINLYNNEIGYKSMSHDRSHAINNKGFGGAVTFHSHSCDHFNAAKELIMLLEIFGLKNKNIIETPRTIRVKDGSSYKRVNTFLHELKFLKREIFA